MKNLFLIIFGLLSFGSYAQNGGVTNPCDNAPYLLAVPFSNSFTSLGCVSSQLAKGEYLLKTGPPFRKCISVALATQLIRDYVCEFGVFPDGVTVFQFTPKPIIKFPENSF